MKTITLPEFNYRKDHLKECEGIEIDNYYYLALYEVEFIEDESENKDIEIDIKIIKRCHIANEDEYKTIHQIHENIFNKILESCKENEFDMNDLSAWDKDDW